MSSSITHSASRPVGSGIVRQAVILFLWTSKPAHRVNTTSISHLQVLKGLAGYPEQKRLPCVRNFPQAAGNSSWCRQVSRSSSVTGSGHQSEHDLTSSPFGGILSCSSG